jgi:hypothetical protein
MEISVTAASHLRRKFIQALLPSMLKQLKIENSKKALVIIVDEQEHSGSTRYIPEVDSLLVVLKPQKLMELGVSLAHELVHCAQIIRGTMKMGKRGSVIWAGKKYSAKTPYYDCPWEKFAFSKQEIIFRRAIEGV